MTITLEAVRYRTTQALLASVVVGAGIAATVLALTPTHSSSPAPTIHQQPLTSIFNADLTIKGSTPITPGAPQPTNPLDALLNSK